MKVYEGNFQAEDLKFGIVVGRFNEFISSKLLSGALDGLTRMVPVMMPLKYHGYLELLKFFDCTENG